MYVKPKKHLGQHFLEDQNIAKQIVDTLNLHKGVKQVLEIGAGTGVLTQFLVRDNRFNFQIIEIDSESVTYLHKHYPTLKDKIIEGDFLKEDLKQLLSSPNAIIGNFPYNISSQIFFKVLENRDQILEVVGMIQKEVADRITSKEGKKTNGILSILLQAFYDVKYEFTVEPDVFNPPPKVRSAVISLKRNDRVELPCNEKLFFRVVKQGFNNRRKTLWNALKVLNLPPESRENPILSKRAEQLSVQGFIELVSWIEGLLNEKKES